MDLAEDTLIARQEMCRLASVGGCELLLRAFILPVRYKLSRRSAIMPSESKSTKNTRQSYRIQCLYHYNANAITVPLTAVYNL